MEAIYGVANQVLGGNQMVQGNQVVQGSKGVYGAQYTTTSTSKTAYFNSQTLAILKNLSDSQLKSIFDAYDTNRSGSISRNELANVLYTSYSQAGQSISQS